MSEKIETLTDATFDEHVKSSDVPVLVDFWAEWCGPCKMISPVLEEIAEEQAGKIRIGKLNIDDNLDVTRRFDVMSIPTLILFKDGEPQLRADRGQAQGRSCSRRSRPTCRPAPRRRGPRRRGLRRPAPPDRHPARRRRSTPTGIFGPATRAALEAFQRLRGLRVRRRLRRRRPGTPWSRPVSGSATASCTAGPRCCGVTTSPSCSSACARLGFDTGRVDGIFGDATVARARRVPAQRRPPRRRHRGRRHPPGAAAPREPPPRARARLRRAGPGRPARRPAHAAGPPRGRRRERRPGQRDRRAAPPPDLGGTRVTELHHPDDAVQAKEANELDVDVFVGLRLNPSTSGCRTAFCPARHDESPGGRRLAELVQAAVPARSASPTPACAACRCPSCARPACPPCSSRWARPAPWSSGRPPWPPPSPPRWAAGPTPPGTDYR